MTQPAPIAFPATDSSKGMPDNEVHVTFDGLPPPAKVAKAVPVTPDKVRTVVSRVPLAVPVRGVGTTAGKSR